MESFLKVRQSCQSARLQQCRKDYCVTCWAYRLVAEWVQENVAKNASSWPENGSRVIPIIYYFHWCAITYFQLAFITDRLECPLITSTPTLWDVAGCFMNLERYNTVIWLASIIINLLPHLIGQYCWRWTGFSFGVDVLVTFNSSTG